MSKAPRKGAVIADPSDQKVLDALVAVMDLYEHIDRVAPSLAFLRADILTLTQGLMTRLPPHPAGHAHWGWQDIRESQATKRWPAPPASEKRK